MAQLIPVPTEIESAGTKPKLIEEFVGRVNTGTGSVSIARMKSPGGWEEPGQVPEFNEYTLVIDGTLRAETQQGSFEIIAGQAFIAEKGEWVRYSSPSPEGAEYIAVCIPAFSPETVHRDT